MKLKIILLYIISLFAICACKKDLGNYDYSPPSQPVVEDMGNDVNALVGDSLIFSPQIFLAGGNPARDLAFDWVIYVDEEFRADHYTGYPLKIVYNLNPKRRSAKLTITDKRNGLKYFYPFFINGGTEFSNGLTVLSVEDGVTKLSFIKDKLESKGGGITLKADIYRTLSGEDLPANPVQLFAKPIPYQDGSVEDFWVLCKNTANPGVIISATTMLRKRNFNEQMFTPPTNLYAEYFEVTGGGRPMGVINGKLYMGIVSTATIAPDFGKFSNPQAGNYTLSKYFSQTSSYFFGFDTKVKAFIAFDSGGGYRGTDYTVSGNGFDPKNIGMSDLLFMKVIEGENNFAFFRADDGTVYELRFEVNMADFNTTRLIKATSKRAFARQDLIKPDTKWEVASRSAFYFTSGDKIYRYNPLNTELRMLSADFGGRKVTMIKASPDGRRLMVGVEGSVFTLDVETGSNGEILEVINDIPGYVVDLVNKRPEKED